MNLVFLDTETTSLRPDRRAWEIGVIIRAEGEDQDFEISGFVQTADLDLGNADLSSLKIGRFYDRHPQMDVGWTPADPAPDVHTEHDLLWVVEAALRDAVIVGAVPNFDTEVLATRMRVHGICPNWHYHLIDVETLAAGHKQLPPKWDFDKLLSLYGLEYAEADRHTALGDARMVRDLYDSVMNLPRTN